MLNLHLFTDASVNAYSTLGYGAYLVVTDLNTPVESLTPSVKLKRFAQTSSAALELQTLLWALDEVMATANGNELSITAYTDSQNIIRLPQRRTHLEQTNYCSSKNKRLNNAELYQEFYQMTSILNCELVKVRGHQPAGQKNKIAQLFGLVDKASRHALRNNI